MPGDFWRSLWRLCVALAVLVSLILGGWAGAHERYAKAAFYMTIAIATMVAEQRGR